MALQAICTGCRHKAHVTDPMRDQLGCCPRCGASMSVIDADESAISERHAVTAALLPPNSVGPMEDPRIVSSLRKLLGPDIPSELGALGYPTAIFQANRFMQWIFAIFGL